MVSNPSQFLKLYTVYSQPLWWSQDGDDDDDDDDDDDAIDYEEMKAYLKDMKPSVREKYTKMETLRNLANGYQPNCKMEEINKTMRELKNEEEEEEEEEKDDSKLRNR